jgi:histidinol-phosphate phosphatase family protein
LSDFDIVVPTSGRPSLSGLLRSLAGIERLECRIIVVDDRADPDGIELPPGIEYVRGRSGGPASARNVGWRRSTAEWIVFLDDDVLVDGDWIDRLATDLEVAEPWIAGVQGRIAVPLPDDRRPTDWERNVAGLEGARWATADMAYRRHVLDEVGGFDERFPRAYREDSDLALRVMRAGYGLKLGQRRVFHPVPQSDPWVSLRKQSGVRDDALMEAFHGRDWRQQAAAPRGRKRWHLATVACGLSALAMHAIGARRASNVLTGTWLALTLDLSIRRIVPGPRTAPEIGTMVATSLLMPFIVAWHHLVGTARARWMTRGDNARAAVLFDRDGTLVLDEPYNGDPDKVVPAPGAVRAVRRLRDAGIPIAVVSNQSGIGRGLLDAAAVASVNRRIEQLLGDLGPWFVCPHAPADGCDCRKPAPGLILRAARALGVPADRCIVIGDIGSDVEAALAAGARPILVPTTETRPDEIDAASIVARDLDEAVDIVLKGAVDG